MATYVLPQVLVFQEFAISPSAAANPLQAHISGPHAFLVRYGDEDERELGRLGFYDRLVATPYAWPNRPAGGKVDTGYVKLWVKNALLKYFGDDLSAGSVITKTSGYNNRVRSATVGFKTNGDFERDAAFLDRDVQPGDIVKVRGLNSLSDPVTLWTYVKRLIGDIVAAVIAAAGSDDDNKDTQGASASVVRVSGPHNCVVAAADGSAYDGLPSGFITETYDIVVLEGSVDSDYTTARVRVISGSGEDDVAEVTPSATGVPTDIGTRGLQVTFSSDETGACSASASDDAVSPDDLIAGQRWQVTVNQAFTAPTPVSGGTYEEENDTTYVVEVTKGGVYADVPEISVTTTNGIDISGPTKVAAVSTFVDIGTKGVQIKFTTGAGLRKGDRYTVEVQGQAEGPMRTIELGNNLDTDIAADSEVGVTLFIKKPLLQIEQNRTGFAPLTNWDIEETQITVNDGIVAYDESWTDSGVPEPLDVWSEESQAYGELFVEYRAWLTTLCNEVGTIGDVGEIEDLISGALHPDNPLKWGVFKALENANGTPVKFTSVCDPDDDESWANVLELLLGRDDVYGLVPLTRRRTVLDLYAAHVKSMSSPENGLWRVLWLNLAGVPEIPVVSAGSDIPGHLSPTTTDGDVCLAVVEDDPQTAGTQYTIVRCTGANGAFITNGVRAGDIVRLLYTGDGFGNFTYSEFIVDEVQSEDQLRLLTGPSAPINTAAKIEIWRNLSATEEAKEVATSAGAWGDRRIRAIWPDQIESSGTIMEGYFLCASLSGLTSGVLPHQGLTNLEIVGYSSVPRTTSKFNRPQLDLMAVSGVWIVTQEINVSGSLGKIFSRHAVTTGDYSDLNQREEMITRNLDSISYRFKDSLKPFIGITNVTPSTQARLEIEIKTLIEVLKTESTTPTLGPQLVDAVIVEIRQHLTFKDRFVVVLNVDLPEPLNNVALHLVVGGTAAA